MIIAEIAQAHDGSLGIAHSYIDALAKTGVDAVKFQTHIADAESSEEEKFRVPFSYQDSSRFEYWKRLEFSIEQWAGLKQHCDDKGVEFISSPFSVAAVNLLEKLNVKRYKIGSGESNNYLMLNRIGLTGKPIILSSGMSDWTEIEETINFLRQFSSPISLMQCTTAYPTVPQQWGLSAIKKMKERFNLPIGFSDHSANIFACLAATALGATFIEFHATFDKDMFGPDSKASLTIMEIAQLVKGVNDIRLSLNCVYEKGDTSKYVELKEMFGKSLSINKCLEKGHIIKIEDLESKKPANQGISAKEYASVIGKQLNCNLDIHSFLKPEHLL
jgi:N,N'-diacetyllegionaminate synthase